MSNKKEIFWRIGLAYLMLILLGVGILWQVFYIQNVQGNYYRALADSITTKYAPVAAERGNIYSVDGRLLATSLPSFEIRMDMKADGLTKELFRKNIDSLSLCMANFFGDKSSSDYKKLFVAARVRGERYFLVKKNVSYPDLQIVKAFPIFRYGQFKGGFIALQHNRREYPFKELANRTIGYMRDATVQPVGLEGQFNSQLTGIAGKRLMQKVSGGEFLPINDKNEIDPQNGKDIISTIDVNLQDVAEDALKKTLIANKADHGCCVVMDVKTGAIRAIANLGKQNDGGYAEDYNYAVGESHEPGSTFKLASMIALLEDGYVNLNDTVDLELGVHSYWSGKFSQTMHDAEHHSLRRVNVLSAFAHSSNVGISKLVNEYYSKNPEKYLQHLRDLGLNQKLCIEIPGEQQPYIQSTMDKTFTRFSLPWMSVGYEVKISPLQILTLYNAVANNGTMMKPYLVQAIDEYGKPEQQFQPAILKQKICSDKTLQALQELLEAVVDSGTARALKNPNYSIAGKTGTAQIADDKHHYADKVYQSSFVGYFPADKPLYSCIVVVNAPSNGIYYGAAVAGPVFKELADKIFSTDLDLHPAVEALVNDTVSLPKVKSGYKPDLNIVFAQLGIHCESKPENAWVNVATSGREVTMTDKKENEETGVVPDVKGMGLRDALYLLENCGLKVNTLGAGSVTSQSIQPGASFQKGQMISITLSL
ncbi:MAG TPA: penicillin-binding protein [Chitinophagales bacterium]|nr:penicillin-binding protein [Chitinophagales bacterium]